MASLVVIILGMLTLGQVVAKPRYRLALNPEKRWVLPRLTQAELARRLGVTVKNPWELQAKDLTTERLVYNLMTKPGYRDLVFQFGLGVGLAVGSGWVMHALYRWQQQAVPTAVAAAKAVAAHGVAIDIAGTVRIAAAHGVIYVSTIGGTGEGGFKSYSFELTWTPIRLVAVI